MDDLEWAIVHPERGPGTSMLLLCPQFHMKTPWFTRKTSVTMARFMPHCLLLFHIFQDAGLHIQSIVGLMRRVSRDGLGEPFWLNDTVPECCKDFGFKTYLEMDNVTRADAEQFLRSAVRTLIGVEDEMEYNERRQVEKMHNQRWQCCVMHSYE